jgi:putative two-component system response regulator
VKEKPKILIIEDEIPVAMTMMALLAANYETKIAMTGAKAIRMAEIETFDLITLDVDLPDMNGFEVCVHLRENPFFQTPIIFVSGRLCAQDIQRGLKFGAVDYITKPFEPFEFKERILSHIKNPLVTSIAS